MRIAVIVASVFVLCTAGRTAQAKAPCGDFVFTKQGAANAVKRIRESGEIYHALAIGLAPPFVVKVKTVKAKAVPRVDYWKVSVNGNELSNLSDIYVRASSKRPNVFVSLHSEIGCSDDKSEIVAETTSPERFLSWVLGVESVEASSWLRGDKRYRPEAVLDGNSSTSWCEGKRGDGVGESITIRFAKPRMMTEVGVGIESGTNGYPAPAAIKVYPNDSKTPISGTDSASFARVEVSKIRIQIAEVTSHPLARTCIGSVTFADGGQDYGVILGAQPKAMAALSADLLGLFAGLNSCKVNEIKKYINFPFSHTYAGSDDGGHYEQGQSDWKNAQSLARGCKKGSVLGAKGILIPWFPLENMDHKHSVMGKLVLGVEGDDYDDFELNEFWSFKWNGVNWRLLEVSDLL